MSDERVPTAEELVLEARGLEKSFRVVDPRGSRHRFGVRGLRRRDLRAVDGVDLTLHRGECLGLVGESGSGKSTLARLLLRFLEPDAGSVRLGGEDFLALSGDALRRGRRRIQMVFQDSIAALDPRRTVADSLTEAVAGALAREPATLERLLAEVELEPDLLARRPHQLSGGQRQRVAIARALAAEPDVLVLDEPVSALDATVRERILELLEALRRRRRLALLFIGHDLDVVARIADRVAVMYLGRVVEEGPARRLFARPAHPYTADLLAAVPRLDARGRSEVGGAHRPIEAASAIDPPPGCAYHPRCSFGDRRCARERPTLDAVDPYPADGPAVEESRRRAACFHAGAVVAASAARAATASRRVTAALDPPRDVE